LAGDGKAARSSARRSFALDGGCLDPAGAFDFHGNIPLRHVTIADYG